MRAFFAGLSIVTGLAMAMVSMPAKADPAPDIGNRQAVLDQARGQTVYCHARGGEPRVHDFTARAGSRVQARYGFKGAQVKPAETAEVLARVSAK